MKNLILTISVLSTLLIQSCQEHPKKVETTDLKEAANSVTTEMSDSKTDFIFPKGQKGTDKFFTGNAYNTGLVAMDSTFTTLVGNVYFEPSARSNWHTHPGGQILIITDGEGYHQIEGEPIQIMKKGDVIKCPPNTRHWHGASPNKALQQMYIVPNTEKGIVDWLEPVTDEQYNNF
ncbi:cupin domain-containing protein [Mangrovimonas spongiae]|uniref:Cupin domain-containing protein n=1 Tax=Mangrovimonas spongiae TaxID=2494697 RepID=A0A3R9N4U7_9FLAO|nr:cupin domain-containing protein [Mangrovimonas spongiae]RSK39055.1 cupin domain-containing protein [Mangrovimonas spongiae]